MESNASHPLLNELVSELKGYWFDIVATLPEDMSVPELSDEQFELMVSHLLYILEANERVNLTRIIEPHDAVILHLLDSLLLLPFIQEAPHGTLFDIGTGAGFPGLTLAIATRRNAVLLDSIGKKVAVVSSCIEQLRLQGVQVVQDRAESFALTHRSSCALVVARAVAPLSVLLEYASPLLQKNGLLVVTKGVPQEEELAAAKMASNLCGFDLVGDVSCELPQRKGSRSIFIYKKTRKPSVKLPRPVGTARKHPFGVE